MNTACSFDMGVGHDMGRTFVAEILVAKGGVAKTNVEHGPGGAGGRHVLGTAVQHPRVVHNQVAGLFVSRGARARELTRKGRGRATGDEAHLEEGDEGRGARVVRIHRALVVPLRVALGVVRAWAKR